MSHDLPFLLSVATFSVFLYSFSFTPFNIHIFLMLLEEPFDPLRLYQFSESFPQFAIRPPIQCNSPFHRFSPIPPDTRAVKQQHSTPFGWGSTWGGICLFMGSPALRALTIRFLDPCGIRTTCCIPVLPTSTDWGKHQVQIGRGWQRLEANRK